MYSIIENRKSESTKYLVLCIIFGVTFAIQILLCIINHSIYVFTLMANFALFLIFFLCFLVLIKYRIEFNGEKIIIKTFKTKLIKIQDIDYYAFSASRINDTFDVIILIKGQEIKIRTHHIKEMINAFYSNNIKRIDGLNINAINKQVIHQRLELILTLIIFVFAVEFLTASFKLNGGQRIESKDINSALSTYYLVDNNRFAIFPEKAGKVFDQGFVKTKTGMQIYLITQYDSESFKKEYERLYNPSLTVYAWPIKFEGERFNYTTIVTKYGHNVFEYACFNKRSNTIAYIYFENTRYDEINFDKKYLPTEFKYYYNEMMTTISEYDYYKDPDTMYFN